MKVTGYPIRSFGYDNPWRHVVYRIFTGEDKQKAGKALHDLGFQELRSTTFGNTYVKKRRIYVR